MAGSRAAPPELGPPVAGEGAVGGWCDAGPVESGGDGGEGVESAEAIISARCCRFSGSQVELSGLPRRGGRPGRATAVVGGRSG